MGVKIEQKDLKYKANKYLYDFQQFETIRSFGESIYTGKIDDRWSWGEPNQFIRKYSKT